MANLNGPFVIEPPPPPPRQYGLFDVALGPMPFPHPAAVGSGVIYVPDTCEDDVFLHVINCPPVSGMKVFSGVEVAVSGDPFAVITSYTCGSIGIGFEEAERRVRTRMSLREQRAVERRVWQGSAGTGGSVGVINGLFRNAINLGAAGCPTEAVELLEQALADNGVVGGILHARPGMAPHLANNHLIEKQSPRLLTTPIFTPYVFGQGYGGTGPTGQAVDASTEWMFASGRVIIWQDSEVFVPPPGDVLNLSTNQLFLLAERVYAVAIECGVWAVQVTRTCTTAGGGT